MPGAIEATAKKRANERQDAISPLAGQPAQKEMLVDVARLDLWHPPSSHRQGPTFLNVLTVLDVPQAVGLMLPHVIRFNAAEVGPWYYDLLECTAGLNGFPSPQDGAL